MEIICLDSSVLIEYYRNSQKEKSFLFKLAAHYQFTIPAIVKYEVYRGDKKDDLIWTTIFSSMEILSFDSECADIASKIYKDLKVKRKLIGTDDILIAATAIKNDFKLATLNRRHFERIDELEIITPKDL